MPGAIAVSSTFFRVWINDSRGTLMWFSLSVREPANNTNKTPYR